MSADDLDKISAEYKKIAVVTDDAEFVYGDTKISMKEALENWTGRLRVYFLHVQMLSRLNSRISFLMQRLFILQRTKLQDLRYLYRYSLVQTVNMTQQKHLNLQVQM